MAWWLASLLSVLLAAPPPEEVRAAARKVLESDDYQRRLPFERETPPPDPNAPRRTRERDDPSEPRLRDGRPREADGRGDGRPREADPRQGARSRASSESSGWSLGAALFWVVAASMLLLFAVWLVSELRGRPRDVRPQPAAPPAPSPAAVVEKPLSAAEILAREGRFAEAIHELLFMTIGALSRTTPRPPPPSHTSREILREAPMPADARSALADLVGAVEISHFGGRPQGRSEWQACLAGFRRFAAAYGGASA